MKTLLILIIVAMGASANHGYFNKPCTTVLESGKMCYSQHGGDYQFDSLVLNVRFSAAQHAKKSNAYDTYYTLNIQMCGGTTYWLLYSKTFERDTMITTLRFSGNRIESKEYWNVGGHYPDTIINGKRFLKVDYYTKKLYQHYTVNDECVSGDTLYVGYYCVEKNVGYTNYKRDSLIQINIPTAYVELCTLKTATSSETPKPLTTPNHSNLVKVYDVSGRPVHGDVNRMPNGVYFLWDGRNVQRKLVVR